MKEIFVLLNNNMGELFKKTSTWIGILFAMQLFIIWLIIYIYLDLGDRQYHFYMNTKTSLEHTLKIITNSEERIKFDEYDGNIARELMPEEEILRKKLERWHLRDMFK